MTSSKNLSKETFLDSYRANGFELIEGWVDPGLFQMMKELESFELDRQGGCLEIGVHHGRLYVLLNALVDEKFTSYAVDVFGEQAMNIDHSGRGDLTRFKENLNLFDKHKGKNTCIVSGDSTDTLVMNVLRNEAGKFKYISIDGGHTAEHTVSDLRLCESLISNSGIVMLDDILNHHWLGVVEGASIYLKSKPTLLPFAIGYNKLFLAKLSFHERYYQFMNSSKLKSKECTFFGYKVVALIP